MQLILCSIKNTAVRPWYIILLKSVIEFLSTPYTNVGKYLDIMTLPSHDVSLSFLNEERMAGFLSQLKLPAAMLSAQAHGRPGPPGKDGLPGPPGDPGPQGRTANVI